MPAEIVVESVPIKQDVFQRKPTAMHGLDRHDKFVQGHAGLICVRDGFVGSELMSVVIKKRV